MQTEQCCARLHAATRRARARARRRRRAGPARGLADRDDARIAAQNTATAGSCSCADRAGRSAFHCSIC